MASRIYEWLDSRLKLKSLEKTLLDEPIPGGASWIYVFGSATLFLFVLQAVTGMFLAVYYAPTPDHAYDSVQFIENQVTFGWFVRGLHHWGASGMVDRGRTAHAPGVSLRSIQAATRDDVDGRRGAVPARDGLRLYRVSVALGSDCLLGHAGRDQYGGDGSSGRRLSYEGHARRRNVGGADPLQILRGPRALSACPHHHGYYAASLHSPASGTGRTLG